MDESFCDGNGECFRIDQQLEAAKVQLTAAHALIAQWRAEANGIIEDVNNGDAPFHEADTAKGWLQCADELEALLTPQEAR